MFTLVRWLVISAAIAFLVLAFPVAHLGGVYFGLALGASFLAILASVELEGIQRERQLAAVPPRFGLCLADDSARLPSFVPGVFPRSTPVFVGEFASSPVVAFVGKFGAEHDNGSERRWGVLVELMRTLPDAGIRVGGDLLRGCGDWPRRGKWGFSKGILSVPNTVIGGAVQQWLEGRPACHVHIAGRHLVAMRRIAALKHADQDVQTLSDLLETATGLARLIAETPGSPF